jgi:hypothetical protein
MNTSRKTCGETAKVYPRHCEEPTGRANARPMTGSATTASAEALRAKAEAIHSFFAVRWIASLTLAMTVLAV